MEDFVAGARFEDRHRLERGERDVLGARVGEADVLEGDRAPSPRHVDGVGVLLNHGDDVEDLEEALEGDEGGHHIEVDVGELGQRPVQAGQVGGQGDQGAEGERTVDGGHAAEAVDERGGQRAGQREGDEEDAGVGGLRDADVAHPARLGLESGGLVLGVPEQLDQHGPADLEALLHDHVHLAVEVVALLGQRADALADEAGRDEEQRHQNERGQRDLPAEEEHGGQDDDHGDEVAHDVGEQVGEGLLGADHVVVEAADQRAGLGPGEEGQRHALDVPEHLGAHVVNEATRR